ncbi:MAG: flotillin domain-containing protein [Povalibacter sp.]
MQSIDSIRIMQVDGLNTGNGSGHGADVPGTSSSNLAEQAVGAALKYRAYGPVVDQLIKEVGLSGDGLGSLVKAGSSPAVTNLVAPAQA